MVASIDGCSPMLKGDVPEKAAATPEAALAAAAACAADEVVSPALLPELEVPSSSTLYEVD